MRILYVHQSADLYGSDRVLLEMITARRAEDCVVLLPCEGPLADSLRRRKVCVHVVPVGKMSRARLSAAGLLGILGECLCLPIRARRLLAGERVDVVHSNTLAVLGGAFIARAFRIPHVWHIHELIETPRFVSLIMRLLVRNFANRVICVSSATKEWLVAGKHASHPPVHLIYNCPPQRAVAETSVHKLPPHSQAQLRLGIFGRINNWKGHRLLLMAMAQSIADGREIHLVVVGDTPPGMEKLKTDLMCLATELKLTERVSMLGFREDVLELMESCDVVVVPSESPEPFGLVALEAMLCKRPVIAAGHGGLLDIVEHGVTGWHFKPGSVEDLSRTISAAADNGEKRNLMGQAGARRVREHFSRERFNSRLEEVYRHVSS